MTWSLRNDIGVTATDAIFQKFQMENYLMEIKNDFFCSKLLLRKDKEFNGSLNDLVPNESDIHPKHLSKACDKLGWVPEDFPSCAVAKDSAAR